MIDLSSSKSDRGPEHIKGVFFPFGFLNFLLTVAFEKGRHLDTVRTSTYSKGKYSTYKMYKLYWNSTYTREIH